SRPGLASRRDAWRRECPRSIGGDARRLPLSQPCLVGLVATAAQRPPRAPLIRGSLPHIESSMLHSKYAKVATIAAGVLLAAAACSDSTGPSVAPGFLGGTSDNHEIGVVVGAKILTLFQLGSPITQKHYALGTSSTVTPTGFSLGGRRAAVPLGNAASV